MIHVVLLSLALHAAWAKTPYSDGELRAVETSDEAKVRELRREEVTQLRIALGRHLPNSRRADLYFRLAEIDLEAYHQEFLLEGRVHEKRLAASQEDKFIDRAHSRVFLSNGIVACQEIIKFRIPYAKLDQVYYFLGFNYGELGDRGASVKYFEYLTKHFPNSEFVGEGYREIADEAFDAQQYRKAIPYYEIAVQKSGAEVRPRVQHKLAWCYYRTKQYDRAVDTLKQAIAGASQSGEKLVNLKEEALRDMAVFMTESGKSDEAIPYFENVAGDRTYYPRMLERLGKEYERNVEPVKAIQVYETLLKTHPESEAAFRVLVKLVDLDLRREHFKEALARIQGVAIPTQPKEPDTQVAGQNLRAMIRRTATEHHQLYRKKQAHADLEIAEAYYTAYLNQFLAKDDPRQETPEIEMYLAEVKRDLGKSGEASALYRKVLDSRDKRYAKEAGALWTASLAEAIGRSAKSKPAGTKAAGESPSELEIQFVDAADQMQAALGATSEGREAALKAAQVLAGYKSTQKDAIGRIKQIIAADPKSPQALTAARLWIQIRADQVPATATDSTDATAALKQTMLEVRENAPLMDSDQQAGGKLHAMLKDQDTRLRIGVIAAEEHSRDFASAGKGYESFAADASSREVAEKAYASAIAAYQKANDPESVERVSAAWTTRYPKSPKAVESLRTAATHFLIYGHFDASAKLFDELGISGDADSLETAARLHEGNGNLPGAQQDWSRYLKLYPENPHRWEIALQLAKSFVAAGQDSEASQTYRYCMAGPVEVAAHCGAELADLFMRARDLEHAKETYRKVSAGGGKGGHESPYVGYARYRLATLLEEEAHFEPLQFPEDQLKKSLNQRLEFLGVLGKGYNSAVEAGGPWAIAALERLANWAQSFANDVDNIPPPASANAEAIQRFKKSLAAVSDPLRKKAVTTWSDGYNKAVAAEALSPSLLELTDHLAEAHVPTPSRAQGSRVKFRIAGLAVDGGESGRQAAGQKVRESLVRNAQDASAWIDYGNLLWGDGKPLLAKLAYDRALSISPHSAPALNNRAAVILSDQTSSLAIDDWFKAAEASALLEKSLEQDHFLIAAKFNRAALLNYYRLFPKAKALWEQVIVKESSTDAQDGLAVSVQGMGNLAQAQADFEKATEMGATKGRFVNVFHAAARDLANCLDHLKDLDETTLVGFEKKAVENLKRTCTQWKKAK